MRKNKSVMISLVLPRSSIRVHDASGDLLDRSCLCCMSDITMKNDHKRVPLAADYAHVLGVATYCFASCEWNVVWCCERISPGALGHIVDEELTAGRIGKKFKDLVRNMPASPERETLGELASEFLRLVQVRNSILHGKPCTAPSGEQRLTGSSIWEPQDLLDAADAFTSCSIKLNQHLHGLLAAYQPTQQ